MKSTISYLGTKVELGEDGVLYDASPAADGRPDSELEGFYKIFQSLVKEFQVISRALESSIDLIRIDPRLSELQKDRMSFTASKKAEHYRNFSAGLARTLGQIENFDRTQALVVKLYYRGGRNLLRFNSKRYAAWLSGKTVKGA